MLLYLYIRDIFFTCVCNNNNSSRTGSCREIIIKHLCNFILVSFASVFVYENELFYKKKSRISLFPVFVRFTSILFVVESAQKHQIVVEINNQIFMFILEKHVFKINIKQGLVRVCVCVYESILMPYSWIFFTLLCVSKLCLLYGRVYTSSYKNYTHTTYTQEILHENQHKIVLIFIYFTNFIW